jgi:hypothetical protein
LWFIGVYCEDKTSEDAMGGHVVRMRKLRNAWDILVQNEYAVW